MSVINLAKRVNITDFLISSSTQHLADWKLIDTCSTVADLVFLRSGDHEFHLQIHLEISKETWLSSLAFYSFESKKTNFSSLAPVKVWKFINQKWIAFPNDNINKSYILSHYCFSLIVFF